MFTPPLRRLTRKTSAGFECIDFAEKVLNLHLHEWQKWALIHALELMPDSTYRFRTVVLLVARQNGKSTLMQVLSLWRMFVDGAPLVIGTAQNLDVAEEQWQGAVDIAEGTPELAAEIDKVDKTNGKKALRLVSGERYKVAAASRRGGRGLSGDLILLDELREHHTWDAWGAVTKTTMARERAQTWAASNAGDRSSVVLAFLRLMAHAAIGNPDDLDLSPVVAEVDPEGSEDVDSLGIFEWSASPGVGVWDRAGWAQANPSLGYPFGVTERAIASAARTDPESVFRTEVLCQWVDDLVDRVIPPVAWMEILRPSPMFDGSYALDVSPDARSYAVGVSDGSRVKVLAHAEGSALIPQVLRLGISEIALDPSGPAGQFVEPLTALGVAVREIKTAEHVRACGQFLTSIFDRTTSHDGDQGLDDAVAVADRRPVGDGGWLWSRKRSSGDICPLVAVTIARYVANESIETPPTPSFVSLDDYLDEE